MDPSIHNSIIYEPRYGSNPNVHQQMNKEDVVCMHVCVCVCVCVCKHTYTQWDITLLSHNKEWNAAIYNHVDVVREYYA